MDVVNERPRPETEVAADVSAPPGAEPDCAFCAGRDAAHRGEPADSNPYPDEGFPPRSAQRYDSDHWLWETGYGLGATEPGGLRWYEAPEE